MTSRDAIEEAVKALSAWGSLTTKQATVLLSMWAHVNTLTPAQRRTVIRKAVAR